VEEVFYRYDASKFHFVIIVTDIKELKIDKLKLDIHNFNKEFFRMYTFDISSFYIDNTLQMLTISRFENKEKAMEYYLQMKINQTHLWLNVLLYMLFPMIIILYFIKTNKKDRLMMNFSIHTIWINNI